MSKKIEKTNVEYLRELIEKGQDERIEFLEAVEKELEEAKGKVIELTEDLAEKDNEDDDDDDDEGPEYDNTIETNLGSEGDLYWKCNNIAIQSLMETFEEKLGKLGHVQLEAALNAL